jgi:hemerythrin superfamily protein
VKYLNNALKSATVLDIISVFSYFRKVGREDCQDEIKRILKHIQHIGEADLARQTMIDEGRISKDLVVYSQKQANL